MEKRVKIKFRSWVFTPEFQDWILGIGSIGVILITLFRIFPGLVELWGRVPWVSFRLVVASIIVSMAIIVWPSALIIRGFDFKLKNRLWRIFLWTISGIYLVFLLSFMILINHGYCPR
jgi:hypothetical protein